MVGQNFVQPSPLHTILIREALCNLDDFFVSLVAEVLGPFFNQIVRNENETRKLRNASLEGPDWPWIYSAVLLIDILGDPSGERIIDMLREETRLEEGYHVGVCIP